MKFPEFTDDLSIVSKLGDNPGADNGLTAEGLKAKFDEGPLALQRFLNSVLIVKLNEIFVAGGQLNDGLIMTGPINMNQNMLFGLADPRNDSEAVSLGFANNKYVPKSRTVNGKALSDDITLSAADVDAAPGSYGWGETKTSYNPPNGDPDNVDRTCVFSVSQGNLPAAGIWRGVAHLNSDVAGQMTIRAFTGSAVGCICTRAKIDGAWQPWEWVNPPMHLGVEYRTTDRYNGKPVYRKLISYSTTADISGNTEIKIPHNITNWDSGAAKVQGRTNSYLLPYIKSDGSTTIPLFEADGIILRNTGGATWSTNRQFFFELWYTKTE